MYIRVLGTWKEDQVFKSFAGKQLDDQHTHTYTLDSGCLETNTNFLKSCIYNLLCQKTKRRCKMLEMIVSTPKGPCVFDSGPLVHAPMPGT